MDHSSKRHSQDQRSTSKPRQTSKDTTSTEESSTIPAIRYFTSLATSSTDYNSPYARNENSHSHHLTLPTIPGRVDSHRTDSRFTDSRCGSSAASPCTITSSDSPVYNPPEPRRLHGTEYMASSSNSVSPILSPVSYISHL